MAAHLVLAEYGVVQVAEAHELPLGLIILLAKVTQIGAQRVTCAALRGKLLLRLSVFVCELRARDATSSSASSYHRAIMTGKQGNELGNQLHRQQDYACPCAVPGT